MTKRMQMLGLLAVTIGLVGNTTFAQVAKNVDSIAKETIRRVFRPLERFKGKAMMLPEVVASLGALRYAEATDDKETIEKIKKLYLAAYENTQTPRRSARA